MIRPVLAVLRTKKRNSAIARPMGDSSLALGTSVHKALGGGSVADVLLWRKWRGGALMLVSATTMWYLFEVAGYNFLTFVANVLLLLIVILFLWAKSASLLNRPLPPIPNMEISERTIGIVADELQIWLNCVLSIAHDITIGRNLKVFLKVALSLWFVSFIGSLFNFLTLVYIGVILILSVPLVYEKYQPHIDEKLSVAHRVFQEQCRKLDETVLSKLPLPSNKEKKMQ
ncbi:hypothetical protein Gohar_019823 [Gossypium harknessii]|uniref:Reticulon-like protein n=1 Tax=Gossypium harknessii TaxID=34285 RepID=A0A7J9I8T2_9ROSI|nr:hypothetical protein [Gossypium harknessii]